MIRITTRSKFKGFVFFCLALFSFAGLSSGAAINQELKNVQILNVDKKPVQIPHFGERVLYIVYADPDASRKGPEKPITDAIKKAADDKRFDAEKLLGMGIINMKDSWLPNALIKKAVEDKIKENEEKGIPFEKGPIFLDFKRVLKNEWELEDSNNVVFVLIVGKNKRLKYLAQIKTKENSENIKEEIVEIIISETKK